MAQTIRNLLATQKTQVQSLGQKDPLGNTNQTRDVDIGMILLLDYSHFIKIFFFYKIMDITPKRLPLLFGRVDKAGSQVL